jgi:hypothetical protein
VSASAFSLALASTGTEAGFAFKRLQTIKDMMAWNLYSSWFKTSDL